MRVFLIYLNVVQSGIIAGLCFKLKVYNDYFKKCDELLNK